MRAALWLLLCAGPACAAAPEPAGPTGGDVPASIAGGQVIHTAGLAALLEHHVAVLVDVAPRPRRPANMAAGALWLPLPHQDIPGSLWMPEAGQPGASAVVDSVLQHRLAVATGHDPATPIVVYCHPHCWLSWNAARRIIDYGYRTVYWYPDGVEGWTALDRPTAPAKPETSNPP